MKLSRTLDKALKKFQGINQSSLTEKYKNWTFSVLNYLFSLPGRFDVFHWWVVGCEEKRQHGSEAELAESAKQSA